MWYIMLTCRLCARSSRIDSDADSVHVGLFYPLLNHP